MSSGHFHSTYSHPDEMRKALFKVWGSRRLNEKFKVDRTYDIPYLAGYSKSGEVIYIDRHLPIVLKLGYRMLPILSYLITHERVEKALLDSTKMGYEEAHKVATYAEHRELSAKGISPAQYERALDPYIKADLHEKILRVPKDLDFRPYKDSRDDRLIARMKAHLT